LIEKTSEQNNKNQSEIVKMYNEKLYMPQYENENSIFYFIREPSLRRFGNGNGNDNINEHINYLNFMEGTAKLITLDNFCYEGILILDGSFEVPLEYNDKIKILIGDKKIKTLGNINI
jgi:hypothetical protein